VVGLNGSGKTHLLQALVEIFLALARQQRPHFPVTIAWELGEGDRRRTLLFNNPGHAQEIAWWQSSEIIPDDADANQWGELIDELYGGKEGWESIILNGNWPGQGITTYLPKAVLAYTTGRLEPWQWLFRREASAEIDTLPEPEDYDTSIERPIGWSRQRELEYQSAQNTDESRAIVQSLQQLAEESSSREYDQDICLLLDPTLLKFALLTVSLQQAVQDYQQYASDEDIESFMQEIRNNPNDGTGLRRMLSQVGWVWPVSVIFQIDFNPDAWGESEARQKSSLLQAMYLLANEVVREPEPSTERRLFYDLKSRCRLDEHGAEYSDIINQFFGGDTSGYVVDALQRFIGGTETSPFDGFKQLLSLHRQGLLTDIQIGVQKADTDTILLFDELSDGEQVYLGRMALFHLMEGESDALLLLDEPEVHFNDKWKREIVNIIDDVLRSRANDVLIATHSSITLTDVFNDEIVLFDKQDGQTVAIDVRSNTFGADPSEVMIRLFGVPDGVGQRAMEWLEERIQEDYWTLDRRSELEDLIEHVGPGFYRTELRLILKKLNNAASGTT
jgi:hypothetical protein